MTTTKRRLRLVTAIAMCAILSVPFLSSHSSVSASNWFEDFTVTGSTPIPNLSARTVSGIAAQYTLNFGTLPASWIRGVEVHIQAVEGNSPVIERVRFNLRSALPPQTAWAPMFDIYVIDRHLVYGEHDIPLPIVARSRDLIFAVRYFDNAFTAAIDERMFDDRISHMRTPTKMRRFVTVPQSQRIDYRDTVFIGGFPMHAPFRMIYGVRFIQLREAAELLGFDVQWEPYSNTVGLIRNRVVYDWFPVFYDTRYHPQGVQIRLINDRTYVSLHYFTQVLNRHISPNNALNNISIT